MGAGRQYWGAELMEAEWPQIAEALMAERERWVELIEWIQHTAGDTSPAPPTHRVAWLREMDEPGPKRNTFVSRIAAMRTSSTASCASR